MKQKPKIQLSLYETELVNNAEWILTKNGVLIKVKQLLLNLQEKQLEYLQNLSGSLPEEVLKTSPKISKGENYNGLPYLILDFPRFFDQKNIFAIRTMFWWGNFFSITLHLSGNNKILFSEKIISGYELLKEKEFYICVHEDQWEHHFENYNYVAMDTWNNNDFANKINTSTFIKLAHKFPLKQWNDMQDILLQHFKLIVEVLTV
ncbi:MAG: hypothetical protein JJE22_00795 [Bacteroidia bacterium]|nr:hypothetical protein [Bacteroidia bacterium]